MRSYTAPAAAGLLLLIMSGHALRGVELRLPSTDDKNVWYRYTDSDTVIVFVHGFLSNSRDCWLYQRELAQAYWPDLVQQDARSPLKNVSIYLAGYYTAVDGGDYSVRDAAAEVFRGLSHSDGDGNPPPMAKKNIIFVAHSMGGVVARYFLENHYSSFFDKNVGLVLIASPSYGSQDADRLTWLTDYFNQTQGKELQWGSELIKDLDSRFKTMLAENRIPHIHGVEGVENRFIVHHPWFWPDVAKVVTAESAARYFGAGVLLPDTDHFSCAKPVSSHHPSYQLLYYFMADYFPETQAAPVTVPGDVAVASISSEARGHIDWCIGDAGEPGCPGEYKPRYADCLHSGHRSCLMRKAINAAQHQHCDDAFALAQICQCQNPAAQRSVIDAGEPAVCAYLARK